MVDTSFLTTNLTNLAWVASSFLTTEKTDNADVLGVILHF
jgi:hypothetical protein